MNGLTAVFDVTGSPAWLKAVILKFALVARLLPSSLPSDTDPLPPVRLPNPVSRVPACPSSDTCSTAPPVPLLSTPNQTADWRGTARLVRSDEVAPTGSSAELPAANKPLASCAVPHHASCSADDGCSPMHCPRKFLALQRINQQIVSVTSPALERPSPPHHADQQGANHQGADQQAAALRAVRTARNQRHRQRRKLRATQASAAAAAATAEASLPDSAATGDDVIGPQRAPSGGGADAASPAAVHTCAGPSSGKTLMHERRSRIGCKHRLCSC